MNTQNNGSIEVIFHDLINPINSDKLDEALPSFLENIQYNEDLVIKVIALIGHKLQSPLELEALTACHIVEFLMREGSHNIHKHVAMFKFLNDLIRVLSPKYLGKRTTAQVKNRVIQLLFCWSEAMPHYSKLKDAYVMLRRNNIIKADPPYNDRIMLKSVARTDRPSYLDENRELLLKSLLNSSKKQDHVKANKLIQKLIQEDDEKIEKQAKRLETIDEARNISSELTNLVETVPAGSNGVTMSPTNRKLADEHYLHCVKLRPTIFRMASEVSTNENISEAELTKVLKANDDLTKAISLFDVNIGKILYQQESLQNSDSNKQNKTDNLLDFETDTNSTVNGTNDLLSSSLLDLGLGELIDTSAPKSNYLSNGNILDLYDIPSRSANELPNNCVPNPITSNTNGEISTTATLAKTFEPKNIYTIDQLSLDAQNATTVYDNDGIRCIATPCQNSISLFTILNSSSKILKNFQLLLSVTKNTKVYIADPDRTEINAFNPIVPSLTINQIVYFENTTKIIGKSSTVIRFRLIFKHGDIDIVRQGESNINLNS